MHHFDAVYQNLINSYMDEHTIIDQLEELAERFGLKIRYEPIKQDEDLVRVVGGLCLLRGEYVLIIDSKAAMGDKIRTFAEALWAFRPRSDLFKTGP
jgi:hypothetical protein